MGFFMIDIACISGASLDGISYFKVYWFSLEKELCIKIKETTKIFKIRHIDFF